MKKVFTILVFALLFSGMMQAPEKTTMNIKDLNSSIEKYIRKNFEGYKAVEAYRYEVIFETKIQKGSAKEDLVFDLKGKFLYKKTEADMAKTTLQTRSTMALKDVDGDISKYVKKNFEGFKLTEAFKYDEVYTVKIVKGAESETLLFDKDGKFVMKVAAPKTPESAKKTDSVPAKKDQPKKADSTKK